MTDVVVIILIGQEKLHLKRCIERLAPLEPKCIWLIESQPDDGGVALAKETAEKYGLRIKTVFHRWPGLYAQQFKWALEQLVGSGQCAVGSWVLRLDADEYLAEDTIEKLKVDLPQMPEDVAGISLELKRRIFGGEIRHATNGIRMVRLFRFGRAQIEQRAMDEHLIVDGKTIKYDGAFYDHNLNSFEWWKEKHRGYALREAEDYFAFTRGELRFARMKERYYQLLPFVRPFIYFFIRYVVRLGFLDGRAGWRWNFWQGFWYRMLVDCVIFRRMREIKLEARCRKLMMDIPERRETMHLRILEVIANFQRSAGTSVFCAETARELAKAGHAVAIAVPDPKADGLYCADASIRVITLSEAMREGWDVVHLHGVWRPMLTRAQIWAKRKGYKVVWSPHGMLQARALRMKWLKKFIAMIAYQRKALEEADVIHVCSDSEALNVARLNLKRPMVRIPLGVDLARNRDVESEKTERRIILFVGRINRGKGLMNLVRAWSSLVGKIPAIASQWRVVIAGFDEEGHAEELRQLAEGLGLGDSLEIRGPVYGEAKSQLYAAASLFVLPSLSENFGSVIVEALAQGVPAIATTGTPWNELPKVGCGWYVNVGAAPLAVALEAATGLSDASLRAMGEAGRKWVRENFTWESVGCRVASLYAELVSKGVCSR